MAPGRLQGLAPAKLNLSLAVHGKRLDGYHEITSLAVGIELFDEPSFVSAEGGAIQLTCDDPSLPVGGENLVWRAADRLRSARNVHPGARIHLQKRIPAGGGLGGGSSDAAMTLMALNRLWQLSIDQRELAWHGILIGSDVPLFFALPAAVIRGRGENVTPVRLSWNGWFVLVMGGWPVSTHAAYENWRESDHRPESEDAATAILAATTAAEITPLLVNELEPAIYRTVPQVRRFHESLEQCTHRPWRLSGAGATAFALFDDETEAKRTAHTILAEKIGREVTVLRAVSGSMEHYVRSDEPWKSQKPE